MVVAGAATLTAAFGGRGQCAALNLDRGAVFFVVQVSGCTNVLMKGDCGLLAQSGLAGFPTEAAHYNLLVLLVPYVVDPTADLRMVRLLGQLDDVLLWNRLQ